MNSRTRRMRACALTLSIIAVIGAFAAQPSLAGGKAPKHGGFTTSGSSDRVTTPDGKFTFVRRSGQNIVTRTPANAGYAEVSFFKGQDRGFDHIGQMVVSPDGRQLYVAVLEDVRGVAILNINQKTGQLTAGGWARTGTDNPWSIAISPDGRSVYTGTADGYELNPARDSVRVYKRNAKTGALTFRQRVQNGKDGVRGLISAYRIDVTPYGKHLYVRTDKGIVSFHRGDHGMLKYVGLKPVKN